MEASSASSSSSGSQKGICGEKGALRHACGLVETELLERSRRCGAKEEVAGTTGDPRGESFGVKRCDGEP